MIATQPTWKLALAGAALFTAGVAAAVLLIGPREAPATHEPPPAVAASGSEAPPAAVFVDIPADAVARAGIVATDVVPAGLPATIRMPATVEPDAYRVIPITAPAGGRVLRVMPQLGDRVSAGSPVAVIRSPELAGAATDHASASAALSTIDRDLERLRKLVAIGAASRQELEAREADRAAALARVDAARAQVRHLGGAGNRAGDMTITAASPGIVTARAANPGEVIERGAPIVTTAALSPVWVIGELPEADMARVKVGDRAVIAAQAYPGLDVAGKVTYIAPQVRRETRTAQVRIETPNEGNRLRFGMLVEARLESASGGGGLAVPSAAIQRVGADTVVYVTAPGSPSRFEERRVEAGAEHAGLTQIRSGLRDGERIVTTGSFFLRAEVDRQGLRPSHAAAAPAVTLVHAPRVIPITVDASAFTPARVPVRHGETVILRFTRTAEQTCATDVMVPPAAEKRALPLNTPVDVRFTAAQRGDVTFSCGMNMLKGTIVVE